MERPLHVLIVEDEQSFADVLALELKETHQYEAATAYSGLDGIEKLKSKQIDVVLLDFNLGDINGLQVLQWMNEQKMETPVIMMTAAGTEEVAVEAMKLGAYDYLSKEHIEIDRLPVTINSVFERYLYRKEVTRREMEEHQMRQQQKDLASLQMFQNTVSSIGQFVNNSLAALSNKITETEVELLQYVTNDGRKPFMDSFAGLKKEFDVAFSGLKSMLDLTTLVTQKLEGIQQSQNSPDSQSPEKPKQ